MKQVLTAAVTMTGLALGVAVDEQARAEAKLKGSLRLALPGRWRPRSPMS